MFVFGGVRDGYLFGLFVFVLCLVSNVFGVS
jgi:hypothetical protein